MGKKSSEGQVEFYRNHEITPIFSVEDNSFKYFKISKKGNYLGAKRDSNAARTFIDILISNGKSKEEGGLLKSALKDARDKSETKERDIRDLEWIQEMTRQDFERREKLKKRPLLTFTSNDGKITITPSFEKTIYLSTVVYQEGPMTISELSAKTSEPLETLNLQLKWLTCIGAVRIEDNLIKIHPRFRGTFSRMKDDVTESFELWRFKYRE